MLEEFVSHEIATEYQPVMVEKFSSRGSRSTSTARKPEFLCSLYFIALRTIKFLSNTTTMYIFFRNSQYYNGVAYQPDYNNSSNYWEIPSFCGMHYFLVKHIIIGLRLVTVAWHGSSSGKAELWPKSLGPAVSQALVRAQPFFPQLINPQPRGYRPLTDQDNSDQSQPLNPQPRGYRPLTDQASICTIRIWYISIQN